MPKLTLKIDTDTRKVSLGCNVNVPSCDFCPKKEWHDFCMLLFQKIEEALRAKKGRGGDT